MATHVSSAKKSNRDHCSDADGSIAYALSDSESSDAYTWAFDPMNLPCIGESYADDVPYDEAPLPNKDRHELTEALFHLHRISTSANLPLLGVLAHNAAENIHKILVLYGTWVALPRKK